MPLRDRLLESQQVVVSNIALGAALSQCLEIICEEIESILNTFMLDGTPAYASIMLLEDGLYLRDGAAPSLPRAYCDVIDGIEIGPSVGSCGTAAFLKKQIITSDIASDPLWMDYKDAALDHGLRASWSTPIVSSEGAVLGSFGIYYSVPKAPDPSHLQLIDRFTHLSSLAIEQGIVKKHAQELANSLQLSNDKFEAITSVMPALALVIDENGTYIDVYGRELDLMVASKEEMVGATIYDLLPPDVTDPYMQAIKRALESGRVEKTEGRVLVPRGLRTFQARITAIDNYLPENPNMRHVLVMALDVTEREEAEDRVRALAHYDPLTGLPNRRLLTEKLGHLLGQIARGQNRGAVLYLDLDDFKRINDSLGHSAGDRLLVDVGKRLKKALRSTDVLARVGGDEFVVVIESLPSDSERMVDIASAIAEKILELFEEGFQLGTSVYKIGVSIGVSVVDDAETTVDDVLMRSDAALYRSKAAGGRLFTFYDPALQTLLDTRLDLEQRLDRAIEQGHITTHFQPQVGPNGELLGAEALIRWCCPERGFVPPNAFIPIAEKSGSIGKLQAIVLDRTCQLLHSLDESNRLPADFSVSVNLSPVQFQGGEDTLQPILDILKRYAVATNRIKLELTEGMLVEGTAAVIDQLQALKHMGFELSIDDFGTGYSSLRYLHTFPVDELKIDKSFVDQLDSSEVAVGIVDAIIALAKHLDLSVIAEGVEREAQRALLVDRGVEVFQGYLTAKPLSSAEFHEWLSARVMH